MALEVANWIDEIIKENPVANGPIGQGDDHLRLLKVVLTNTFLGDVVGGDIWDSTGGPLLKGPAFLNGLAADMTLDLDPKISLFGAAVDTIYLIDTTSTSFIITLPDGPNFGDRVGYVDYGRSFPTNNGVWTSLNELIEGSATDYNMDLQGASGILRYIDVIKGWMDIGGMA